MPEIRVSVNLDDLTIGDIVDINGGKKFNFIGRKVKVEGYENTRDVPIAYLHDVTKALKAKLDSINTYDLISPIPLDKIHIVGIEKMTLGDMEDIEGGGIEALIKFASIDGYKDILDAPYKALGLIAEKLRDAINEAGNPKD